MEKFILNARVYDIETYKICYYFLDYDINTGAFHEFEISKWKNEVYEFVRYLRRRDFDFHISFNGVGFDAQVVQYIVDNHEGWYDLNGEEINRKIYSFSQTLIDDQKYELKPPYRDGGFIVPQIDLFKIHHFDNKAKRTGLKWLQYMMNYPNLETLPYDFRSETLTLEEMQEVKDYCKNDVLSTYEFYKYTIGEVEHESYKGKNKIQDRFDLIEEGLLPNIAINYSDSKIGDELNKRSYCALTGKNIGDLFDLKKNRKPTRRFTFGQAIPSYVKFHTPELKAYYNSIKGERVSLSSTDKQKYPITFRGTTYSIMRGGIHSVEKNRMIVPSSQEILRDADVGAQYPSAIRKRKLFPSHLGIEWNDMADGNIKKKDFHKQEQKKNIPEEQKRKHKGLEGMFKLALNAGLFGKTIETTNWQYGPEVGYYCTIGNEFEILMLIEMLELGGIHCISGNTDGIVCLFSKALEDKYYEVCHKWETIVGNSELGRLEYTDFKGLYQESVNHYVAVKKDGKIKVKGRIATEDEIQKNNSDKISRIERIALVKYFSENIPVEETIRGCKDIFQFCIGKKESKDYRWELINKEGNIEKCEKVIRFYISKEGRKLIKRKKENSEKTGPKVTNMFGGKKVVIFNKKVDMPFEEYNIDYEFYINNILLVVNKIERGRTKKFIPQPKEQMTLF